ncbi:MAG TPA: bifunctional riboflavin kinase/FAD synthetase [Deltaproteobacteria bacterium]|nr:bifunctional riboflavin kinase/FAD synthetase [Deltaproteobacteria bacterium]
MEVLKREESAAARGSVVTLGNFDGIHLGHRRILERVRTRARELGAPSTVYTFEPHPLKVVAPEKSPPLILPLEEKIRLIGGLGIDYLVLADFTKEFASQKPRRFVVDELVERLAVREVMVGHDFSFGKGKGGTVEQLAELGRELGFAVTVIGALTVDGEVVSSSRIRRLIGDGRVGEAARLLTRPFTVYGEVVRGKGLGARLGFPTANIAVETELLPRRGVYAAAVECGPTARRGVANVGTAPTAGGKDLGVEVHILDFDGDLYGSRVAVGFLRRLRDERRFDSLEELAARIRDDCAAARRVFDEEAAAEETDEKECGDGWAR